ncbi:MAG: hypothetical protein RBT02_01550 [Bacteroidales bacterium]|jgi:hypothetical protein|nr:hypothetical protein [Bacteroidales bacterium]
MRYITLFLLIAAVCLGCDPLTNPVSGRLAFSSDTISFDTVFSGIGSATMEFRVINNEEEPLSIDRIWLGGGSDSPFSLNINGLPASTSDDLILARGDSIFIFVEVTIDPAGGDMPVAVIDSVNFLSGRYSDRVILEAWGQDIRLVDEDILTDVTWGEGKPYVINGSLFVDTLATLTMNPGTRVYLHHNARVTVAGSVRCMGLADKRITIATDRLEEEYTDVPGRWKGIRFLNCSRNNILNFTEVRNAEIAVELAGEEASSPDLVMNGAMLMHNSVASLVARQAEVFAVNSVFAHSGFSTISLTGGGNYDFIHCTMTGRWEYGYRSEPVMFIGPGDGDIPHVSVFNSVITGTLDNELFIDASSAEAALRFRADSSLIMVDTLGSQWYTGTLFRDVVTGLPPGFIDEAGYDYRPDTLSPLVDKAGISESVAWPFDIRNKPRPTGAGPDIGAFERQLKELRIKN